MQEFKITYISVEEKEETIKIQAESIEDAKDLARQYAYPVPKKITHVE